MNNTKQENYDWKKETKKLPNWTVVKKELKEKETKHSVADELLPVKFQPIACKHFVFYCEGIDPFLVKNVKRPLLKKTKSGNFKPKGNLVITLYESVSPSTSQQIDEWVRGINPVRTAELVFLDPVGTKVQSTTFNKVELVKVEKSTVSYDNSSLNEIVIYLRYKNETLNF